MSTTDLSRNAAEELKLYVDRIEQLQEERAGLAGDIKDILAEAQGNGFSPKIIKKVLKHRKQDPAERAEEEALLHVYLDALASFDNTPLGAAAKKRDRVAEAYA